MRVCVIGAAGGVGSATSAELVGLASVDDLVLVDSASEHLAVVEMDLSVRTVLGGAGCVVRIGRAADAADADVVVFAASVRHRDGVARLDFLAENLKLLDTVLAELPPYWSGSLVIATNPVDPLCTVAARRLGPAARVLGYCMNDSLRLAEGVAIASGRHRAEVTAWVLGEHGSHMVPLRERVTVAGKAISLSAAEWAVAVGHLWSWYQRWQRHRTGMTSMWTSGAGISRLVAATAAATPTLLPVCAPLSGQYGVRDVCLGVPVMLSADVCQVEEWPLAAPEGGQLRAAAELVEAAVNLV